MKVEGESVKLLCLLGDVTQVGPSECLFVCIQPIECLFVCNQGNVCLYTI